MNDRMIVMYCVMWVFAVLTFIASLEFAQFGRMSSLAWGIFFISVTAWISGYLSNDWFRFCQELKTRRKSR